MTNENDIVEAVHSFDELRPIFETCERVPTCNFNYATGEPCDEAPMLGHTQCAVHANRHCCICGRQARMYLPIKRGGKGSYSYMSGDNRAVCGNLDCTISFLKMVGY